MRLLISIFVFFSCLPLISSAKEVDVEGLFSQMSELRLDIQKVKIPQNQKIENRLKNAK